MSHYPAADFLTSAAQSSQFPIDSGAEVAFAGRSNSGKSSAINAIVARKGLARTSKTPGRTRLLNFFVLGEQQRLVDLPGYGYAAASAAERDSWIPMTTALAQRASLRGVFVIVDSRRGLLPGDDVLMQWATSAGKPLHVLLSKADKLKRAEARKVLAETIKQLGERGGAQLFSAQDGSGIDLARERLDEWLGYVRPEKKSPR
jgi:GTP-binding protein